MTHCRLRGINTWSPCLRLLSRSNATALTTWERTLVCVKDELYMSMSEYARAQNPASLRALMTLILYSQRPDC